MTVPVTLPPTAPARSQDSATFSANADAFVAWLETSVGQMNSQNVENNSINTNANTQSASATASATSAAASAAAAINATGYVATSSTSITMGTLSGQAVVLNEANKLFQNGDAVALIRRSDPNTRLNATIASYTDAQHFTINVASSGVVGSGGPYADWVVLGGIFTTPQAAAADFWTLTSYAKVLTPALFAAAQAFQTLTDASTIAWDVPTNGFNATVTLGGNRTVGAITNIADGQSVALRIVQDGTGSRTLSWNSQWDFGAAGTPVLSTTAAKVDWVFGTYSSASGKIRAGFNKAS